MKFILPNIVSDAIEKVNKMLDANIEQMQSNLVANGAATLDFLSTLCFTNGKPSCVLQGTVCILQSTHVYTQVESTYVVKLQMATSLSE